MTEKTEARLHQKMTGGYLPLLNEAEDFLPRFLDLIYTEVLNDGNYHPHTHIHHELITAKCGEYRCVLEGERLCVHPGEMLFIQQGQRHEDILQGGTSHYAVHFVFRALGESPLPTAIFLRGTPVLKQIARLAPGVLEDFLAQMRMASQPETYGAFRMHNALFNVFLRRCFNQYPQEILQPCLTQRVTMNRPTDLLKAVFASHLEELPDLKTLCTATHLSSTALHRLCQACFNLPPRKAFMHFKMLHILDFIRANPLIPLKQVSAIFGFRNQFHFSRVFRQEMGYSPSLLNRRQK
ncbi:MAG: helix-turn-helix domain-containing protein [Victivallales bacterium]|nr:helix-turn-helix domain-containing protein [Victivallales bacterium]